MYKSYTFLIALLFTTTLLQAQQQALAPKREFRGVWVATVQNIDWPSKPVAGVTSDQQKQELVQLLDEHQQTGINAIMLQIRPSADAFYARGREEWSMFLTGKQGQAPNPFYDPLDFAILEAHKRGMELHAWFNPYRATNDLDNSHTSATHITRTHPEWFFTYGGKKYFNPGLPEVRQYIIQVIMDVVRNYDIDGVHFDDYFYPYPGKEPLPDSATYQLYGQEFADIDDWRRNNVDTLIHTLSDSIHAEKSYVKFGISPFGIWRNKAQDPRGSESNGLSGYSALFADARKWAQQGWVDYVNPQVYFPFYYPAAPYEKLVDWWSTNAYGKHLYIGQAVYRAMEDREGWRDKQQLPNQMRYLRHNPSVQGSVFFSSKSLTDNLAGFRDSLQYNFYQYPALPPVMTWLDSVPPPAPQNLREKKFLFFNSNKKTRLEWDSPKESDSSQVYGYVIYRFADNEPLALHNPANIIKISFDHTLTSFTDEGMAPGHTYRYVVTTIDRLKNESTTANALIKKIK
ncbi:family 10 glycosylhydrolase [Pontibacter sp. 172403-2]|uniref:glycoside hydrolase family 10 protein n=1 Tax=Pontibacter rufus TaxID=2791028 RepID=UPI0018AFCA2C|nr:family 10 glycosylhydrolase [Pontibacter sp. 172403-2]MBF9251957.1 family 10 glycosylhydrolase [Pontibacter sp. 172403-2]